MSVGDLIKKHHYWPKSVPRYLIDWNFVDKEVGDVDKLEYDKDDGR